MHGSQERLIVQVFFYLYFYVGKLGTPYKFQVLIYWYHLVARAFLYYRGEVGLSVSHIIPCPQRWSEERIIGPRPGQRWCHTAVALSSQSLLLSGGDYGGRMLSDYWILDLSTRRWREVGDWCMAVHVYMFLRDYWYETDLETQGNMLVNFELWFIMYPGISVNSHIVCCIAMLQCQ